MVEYKASGREIFGEHDFFSREGLILFCLRQIISMLLAELKEIFGLKFQLFNKILLYKVKYVCKK